jgi:hypothetical protein
MIGLKTGDVGHGLAFLALIVTVLGFAGVIGHRRAAGTERLRRAGMYDIDIMSGQQFELRLVEAFQHAGYRVQHVGGVGDFGTDLLLEEKGIRTVVQAKRGQLRRTAGRARGRRSQGTLRGSTGDGCHQLGLH